MLRKSEACPPRWALLGLVGILVAGCDLIPQAPDVALQPVLQVPLLRGLEYQFMGRGEKVFLDTTRESVRKIFKVEPGSARVSLGLEQTLDIGKFDESVPPITVRGLRIEVSNQISQVSGGLTVLEDQVRFSEGDFVEIADGWVAIPEIRNTEPVPYEFVRIVLRGLRRAPYGAADSVVIRFEGAVDRPEQFLFRRLEPGDVRRDIRLPVRGMRLYPRQGRVGYDVYVRPAQFVSQPNPQAIVIQLAIEQIVVSRLQAHLVPRTIWLGEDRNRDGRLDIDRREEARITQLSDLRTLSQALQNLKLANAQMVFEYRTNLLLGGVLYGVFEGRRADGSRIELLGRGPYAITGADTVSGFLRGAQLIRPTIKLPLSRPVSADQLQRLVLDDTNSNLSAFLSALPVEVRFVGKFLLNPSGEVVTLRTPVEFQAQVRFQLPLSLSNTAADPLLVRDTIRADLSDLPKNNPDEELRLLGGTVRLGYRNGLPFSIQVSQIRFLDANRRPLAIELPRPTEPLELAPAPVDASGLASGRSTGTLQLTLREEELRLLHQTRYILLLLRVGMARPGAVIRATDRIAVDMSVSLQLNARVRS
jgi:hypothetical protein|nr:MAG: hypothetical protein KatS3mg041_1028 [Bacteroidota bacterium]